METRSSLWQDFIVVLMNCLLGSVPMGATDLYATALKEV